MKTVDKTRYIYLQGLYMKLQMMGPYDPHPLKLFQKNIDVNMDVERLMVDSASMQIHGTTIYKSMAEVLPYKPDEKSNGGREYRTMTPNVNVWGGRY